MHYPIIFNHSLVKVIVFFLIWGLVWLPVAIPLANVVQWHPNQLTTTPKQKIAMLASLYLVAPIVVWLATRIEGVSFEDYGLNFQPTILISLALGLGLSVASLAIAFGFESLCGWIEWRWENSQLLLSSIFPVLLLALSIASIEELIFRGFLLNELQSDFDYAIAAIISSLIFALSHLLWEQKETLPQLPGLFLMGMVLVEARFLDAGSLGLAWGLHAGWIWGLTCLDSAQMINWYDRSPIWIVGIDRKPLAGAIGILCLLGTGLTIAAIYLSA